MWQGGHNKFLVPQQHEEFVSWVRMGTKEQRRAALVCRLVADVTCRFGEVRVKLTGASMLPSVWPGDVAVVWRANPADLRPGHIVLYLRQGELIAHRVTSVYRDRLITRGDILPQYDPPIDASNIVGQVVCILRNGRSLNPEQSSWQRIGSSILRRSDCCTRMILRAGRRLRRPVTRGMLWVS
jgi:signal peptidase I